MVLLSFFLTLFNISLSIKTIVTATLIDKALLQSLYFRLVLKVIKYFATSPNSEKARKQFIYESGKSNAFQKKQICLQCYPTITRSVKILSDNQIDLNENKDIIKDLNEIPSSDDWFPYECIGVEVNNKVDKTKVQHVGDEMEQKTKHYAEFLNHNPN